jgi:surface antigen
MRRSTTRTAAVLLSLAVVTTSCTNTMEGMSRDMSGVGRSIENNPKAVLGSLGGAGGGALIAGLAGASPAWIVGSAVMGGLLGGYVGHRLDERDRRMANEAATQAFERNRAGHASVWTNPDNGHRGEITPTKTYQLADGTYCRRYEQHIWIGGEQRTSTGTACRQRDGTWQIQT